MDIKLTRIGNIDQDLMNLANTDPKGQKLTKSYQKI